MPISLLKALALCSSLFPNSSLLIYFPTLLLLILVAPGFPHRATMGSMPMQTSFDVDHVLSQLNTAEKVALLSGVDFWHTASVPRLGVPAIRVSDGPNGVRGTRFFNGVPAACLPCG